MAPDCHLDSFFLFLFATGVLNYYSSKNCLHSNYLSWEIKQHDSWLASVNSSVSHCFATTMDCSPPGFSVHGIFQAGILEWVAISSSRGYSWPRDQTQVSCIAGRRFALWATREAWKIYPMNIYQQHYQEWFKVCLLDFVVSDSRWSQGKLFTGWCKPLWFK